MSSADKLFKGMTMEDREEAFFLEYINTGNASAAARSIGFKNAAIMGKRYKDKLKSRIDEYILVRVKDKAPAALERILDIAVNGKNEKVKLEANKYIMDMAGYKPVERKVNVNVELSEKEINAQLGRLLNKQDNSILGEVLG